MQQRITKITLRDFRAFWGSKNVVTLPAGENLLLYGENGSGKSSLFKGLDTFFASAETPGSISDDANLFKAADSIPGIQVEFTDFATATTNTTYLINEIKGIDFLERANLSKAFLGYAHIQAVHTDESHLSGHFKALLTILKDYTYTGNGQRLNDMWEGLKIESGKRWSQRLDTRMKGWLTTFDAAMLEMKASLSIVMGELLHYFDNNLGIEIDYQSASYDRFNKLSEPFIKIRVSYFNKALPDKYSEILNEARLSSLAISLYLASLLTRPTAASPYRILFLDDALIGLDNGNRMPLLKILNEEFADYQVFMTTYDKYWYETAKDWFEGEQRKNSGNITAKWTFFEMYSVIEQSKRFAFPVILQHESFMGKAIRYMNDPVHPDYSAAANNFRKAAEQILKAWIPEHEMKYKHGEKQGESPDFQSLSSLIEIAEVFFDKLEQSKFSLIDLRKHLKILLNPLSHYNPETPIYKSELAEMPEILLNLEKQLRSLVETNSFKVIAEPGNRKLRFKFNLKSGETGYYVLEVLDYWYIYTHQDSGKNRTNEVKVRRVEMFSLAKDGSRTAYRGAPQNYASLLDAFEKIGAKLSEGAHVSSLEGLTYKDVLEVQKDKDSNTWEAYSDIIT